MNNFKVIALLLLIISTKSSLKAQETGQDQLLKRVVIGTYISTLLAEIALTASPSFQSMIFGNGPVNEITKNNIESVAHNLETSSPVVQQAYPFWHALVGPAFSNHSTLFVDPKAINNGEISDSIKKALINIEYSRDRNILIAALALPVIVFGTIKTTSFLLKKISPPNSSFLGGITSGIEHLSKNFTLSSLITLTAVLGFIKIQDYYLATR